MEWAPAASGRAGCEPRRLAARTIAELIPNSEVFEMASVRHWPHFEDPEAFNAAAVEFLTR